MLPKDSSELSSQKPDTQDEISAIGHPQAQWSDLSRDEPIPPLPESGFPRSTPIAESSKPKRGRKPRRLKASVERGILRLLNYTNVPFDRIAEAVEKSNGPKKQWLRNRLSKITDTSQFGALRLPGNSQYSRKRKDEQMAALQAAGNPQANVNESGPGECATPTETLDRSNAVNAATFSSGARAVQDDNAGASEDALSISQVTRVLESNGDEPRGYFDFFAKRLSATAGTIASRLTSRQTTLQPSKASSGHSYNFPSPATEGPPSHSEESLHKCHSADSDFKKFYDRPSDQTALPTQHSDNPSPLEHATDGRVVSSVQGAISRLLKARALSMSDDDVEEYLIAGLPDGDSLQLGFVNATDERGVTPLHLAVAYGYIRVCGRLIKCGANHQALTTSGMSISTFAKAAQQLADKDTEHDIKLYQRIMHCRQWVKHGKEPPIPGEGEGLSSQQPRPPRRTATEVTLTPVPESPSEPTIVPAAAKRQKTRRHEYYGDDGNDSGFGKDAPVDLSRQSTQSFTRRPQFANDFSDSPIAFSILGRARHGTQATDFAPQNYTSRTSAHSSAQTIVSNAMLPQQSTGGHALMPSDSASTLELSSAFDPNFDQGHHHLYRQPPVSANRSGYVSVMQNHGDNVHENQEGPVDLFGYSSNPPPMFNHPNEHQGNWTDHDQQHPQHPWLDSTMSQVHPTLQSDPRLSNNMSGLPAYSDGTFSVPLSLAPGSAADEPAWSTCEHGHPYKNGRSYCNIFICQSNRLAWNDRVP